MSTVLLPEVRKTVPKKLPLTCGGEGWEGLKKREVFQLISYKIRKGFLQSRLADPSLPSWCLGGRLGPPSLKSATHHASFLHQGTVCQTQQPGHW